MTDNAEQENRSTKPYLMRAIYQWAIDQQLTPQVLVDADADHVQVPPDCVKDGRIVLTLHPQAVKRLEMGNQYLLFSARFAGKPFEVCIPVAAILAIYCRENGHGIVFQADDGQTPPAVYGDDAAKKPKESPVSHLKLVK